MPGFARQALRDVLVNKLAASAVVPNRQRWRLLRFVGMDVERCEIYPGHFIGGRKITIGAGSILNYRVFFDCSAQITLDPASYIGPGTMVLTGTHELGGSAQRCGELVSRPVTVGRGTWVGASVTILPGVTIGPGCVIAAGSLVTGDCEPDCLYAGVPAVLKRRLDSGDGTGAGSGPPS